MAMPSLEPDDAGPHGAGSHGAGLDDAGPDDVALDDVALDDVALDDAGLVGLVTEQVDPRYGAIDTMSSLELATAMNDADATVAESVRAELPHIAAAIDAITERLHDGGRLVYVGAGSAGRVGVLDASETGPTFGTPAGTVIGVIAGGPEAIFTPREGAEDDAEAGAAGLSELEIGPRDAVVGIASSGRTPYVRGALDEARARGALAVALSCNPHAEISAHADIAIEVVTGPEVLAGSTRLKAGTAQKMVCNMITTITMVRLGKTYGSHMVDLRATNYKLRVRAARIVGAVTGAPPAEVEAALDSAAWDAKLAIVMIARGVTPEQGRAAIARADGHLRRVLEEEA